MSTDSPGQPAGHLATLIFLDGRKSSAQYLVPARNPFAVRVSRTRGVGRETRVPETICTGRMAIRFAESARAVASHTGATAGADDVCDAAFRRAGIERTFEIDELFDTAELLARHAPPRGPNLAIVTNAGGPGVIATDALIARDGVLAKLSDEVVQQLDGYLPAYWSRSNPIDILGDATADRFTDTLRTVLSDPGTDAVLVILTPQAMTDPVAIAHAVGDLARGSTKPVLASWMGGSLVEGGTQIFNAAGVPTYASPEHAVRAFMHLVAYGRNRQLLYETPQEVLIAHDSRSRPSTIANANDADTAKDASHAGDSHGTGDTVGTEDTRTATDVDIHRAQVRSGLISRFSRWRSSEGQHVLSEQDSKAILEHYGIPTTKTAAATSARQAIHAANEIGYPVVLKILSPDITRVIVRSRVLEG